ncbi:hypothetical protein [Microvirga vignae]|nr:hypothetical protein [Microvirga vignae]
MIAQLLGNETANDPAVRAGRVIGNVIGTTFYPVLAGVVLTRVS